MTLTIWARLAILTHVGVADEAVEEAGHDQRVFQVVDLLDQVRGELAARRPCSPAFLYQTFHSSKHR